MFWLKPFVRITFFAKPFNKTSCAKSKQRQHVRGAAACNICDSFQRGKVYGKSKYIMLLQAELGTRQFCSFATTCLGFNDMHKSEKL